MSLEASVAAQTATVQDLIDNFSAKKAEIDTAASNAIASMASAISEKPYYRLTSNQTLDGTTGSPPTGWSSNVGITHTLIQSTTSGTPWENKSPLEQEFLTAIGSAGSQYLLKNFNIWSMSWDFTNQELNHTLYQKINLCQTVTSCAITKLISGEITGFWAHGATSTAKLTGKVTNSNSIGYSMNHPLVTTPTGEIYYALPCTLAGKVDLSLGLHNLYPYIGATQND